MYDGNSTEYLRNLKCVLEAQRDDADREASRLYIQVHHLGLSVESVEREIRRRALELIHGSKQ